MAKTRSRRRSKGIGDTVEKITEATGIKKAVEMFTEATGIDCGCDERKEKLIQDLYEECENLKMRNDPDIIPDDFEVDDEP